MSIMELIKDAMDIQDALDVFGYHSREDKLTVIKKVFKDTELVKDDIDKITDMLVLEAGIAKKINRLVVEAGLGCSALQHVQESLNIAYKFDVDKAIRAYFIGDVIGVLSHTPVAKGAKDGAKKRKELIMTVRSYIEYFVPEIPEYTAELISKSQPYEVTNDLTGE